MSADKVYKVNYSFTTPEGTLRNGARILMAENEQFAIEQVRKDLVGKLRFLKVKNAVEYEPDQIALPLETPPKINTTKKS